MCTERPESFGQRLSQEFDKSGQEGVHGHRCAGEKQRGLFFVALFPVALSARGAVAMAFVTSSWLAFPELGGHPLHIQPLVLCYPYHTSASETLFRSSFYRGGEETRLGCFS